MAAVRGYLAVVGGVLVHLTLGTIYTFGNLTPYLTSYIRSHSSPSDITYGYSVWIYAVGPMGQGIAIYFGGLLEHRFGPRITTLIGAWFMSLGVFLTYFSVQYSFMLVMLTYGIMFGVGIGLAYAVPMACAMRWMPEKKGLVNGFVVAGFGGGAFIFNQIQTNFINPLNKSPDLVVGKEKYFSQEDVLEKVPYVFLLLGSCYAVMQFIGCMLLTDPPPSEIVKSRDLINEETKHLVVSHKESKHGGNSPDSSDTNATQPVHQTSNMLHEETFMLPKEILKTRAFYMLWFIFLVNGQGVTFISSLYKAFGQTFISDDVFLAWVGAFAALFNAVGRIMWGHLADRSSFKVAMMCLCCSFTVFMLTLPVTKIAGEAMFFLWVCLLFLSFSGSFSLMPTATARCFGQKYYTNNYGLIFTSQVVTAPIGALLTSQLNEAVGWTGMFYMVAGFSFIGFLLAIFFDEKTSDGSEV